MTKLTFTSLVLSVFLAGVGGAQADRKQADRKQGDRKKDDKAPTLDEALAWLKKLDTDPQSAQKQPRIPNLIAEDLKTLKSIKLGGHRASDGKHVFINAADFKYLAALPALERADLVEIDGLTDEALVHIGKITTITELNLGDAAVTSAGLKSLAKLKGLTSLDLGWTKDVGDEAIPLILQFSKLQILGLGGTKITDRGLALIPKLTALKDLRIPATGVTDAGLLQLAPMKSLTTVNVGQKSKVTPQGIAKLKSALPNCSVLLN